MSSHIKLLWMSLEAPQKKPTSAGENVFSNYFLRVYQHSGFDIKIVARVNNEHPTMDLPRVETFYLSYKTGFFSKLYNRLLNLESRLNPFNRNANLLSNQLAQFMLRSAKRLKARGYSPDIVILEWTSSVVLCDKLKRLFPSAKFVASEHDVSFVGIRRKAEYYSGIKKQFWRIRYHRGKRKELASLQLCDIVQPFNPDNATILQAEGIAAEKIKWLVPYFNDMRALARKPNGRDILFYGAMGRTENYLSAIWFIENVMPLLADLDVRFVVLGSHPHSSLKRYASERVVITGFVDSIEPYFEQSMCLAAPLVLGAGIKVKIAEALSSGVPTLTNAIGIEGFHATDGTEYLHCETAQEYATAIRNIKAGNVDTAAMTAAARAFMDREFSFEQSAKDYIERLVALAAK